MVNFPGRNDRRRELREEVCQTPGTRMSLPVNVPEDAPRYSDAAGVENHPQVTDFVPRRYGTLAFMGLFGVSTAAIASALHYFVAPVAGARGGSSMSMIDLTARGNLAEWLSAIVMFIASGFCVLTYSLRRHRIDDTRRRYRVWWSAALACLVLSANSVTGLHEALADVLTRATSWSALHNGAVWWIALAGVPLGWIFARLFLDVRECRVAGAFVMGAAACFTVSAVSYLGFGPPINAELRPIATTASLLMGHWLLLTGIVANARYVVLDAQGLIVHRRQEREQHSGCSDPQKDTIVKPARASAASSPPATMSISRQTLQTVKAPADSNRWIDGSRFERERYDADEEDDESSDMGRRLSKADRKRLRRMKTEGRAA